MRCDDCLGVSAHASLKRVKNGRFTCRDRVACKQRYDALNERIHRRVWTAFLTATEAACEGIVGARVRYWREAGEWLVYCDYQRDIVALAVAFAKRGVDVTWEGGGAVLTIVDGPKRPIPEGLFVPVMVNLG